MSKRASSLDQAYRQATKLMLKPKTGLDLIYRRVTPATWERLAPTHSWGRLPETMTLLKLWMRKHRGHPSPFLVCRTCESTVLDPMVRRLRDDTIDLRDASSESFAKKRCQDCKP